MTRGRALAVWTLALAVVAGAAALTFASEHEDDPWTTVILHGSVALGFVGTGLIAWLSRPANRTGMLMTVVGFTWLLAALTESNEPVIHSLGMALGGVVFVFFGWLLLAFPGGRLVGTFAKLLVAAVGVTTLLQVALVVFGDHERHLGCSDCPRNAFAVDAPDAVGDALFYALRILLTLVLVGFASQLVMSWRRATPAYRRAVVPVFISGGATLLVLGAAVVDDAAGGRAAGVLSLLTLLAVLSVPVSMLIGLLRSRLAHRGVGLLLRELPEQATPEHVVGAIRRTLHDPTLEIAFWSPERGYVDADGHQVELPGPESGRATTLVEYEGRPVAAFVHDPSLLEEPELLESVVAAARLGLEKDRLQAELKARLDELQRERDFIRTVVNSAPSFFCLTDLDGGVLRYNASLQEAAGRVDDEHDRGRLFWELFAVREDRERVRNALTEPGPAVGEVRLPAADGGERTVAWTKTPIFDEQGLERRLFCGLDVTERNRHEEELRASRARIVEAGDAERRRLERNLHDGAQQRLVSLSLALRLARGKVRTDPVGAEALLEAAADELSRALDELRELARGIHPAVLSDRGLDAALEALAARSAVPVEIEGAAGTLPSPVAAAAYYVVAEALTNVAKYARADGVTVRVGRVDGRAVVEVEDDGVGGADAARGTGLRGLADRVEALDGTLAVVSAAGAGTRVRAEIPVA